MTEELLDMPRIIWGPCCIDPLGVYSKTRNSIDPLLPFPDVKSFVVPKTKLKDLIWGPNSSIITLYRKQK
jgi:hypothetical protein